jgi:hypothetical protein
MAPASANSLPRPNAATNIPADTITPKDTCAANRWEANMPIAASAAVVRPHASSASAPNPASGPPTNINVHKRTSA